jgi:hypothetical protein
MVFSVEADPTRITGQLELEFRECLETAVEDD